MTCLGNDFRHHLWASNYESRIHCFTTPQKRILRIIGGDNPRATSLLQETKIMRFHNLNMYFTGIGLIMNNLLPKSFVNYFVKAADTHKYNRPTMAAGGLSAQYARTNYRKFALGYRRPVIWNVIPPALQALQPLGLFISSWKVHINKLYL